MKYYSSKTVTQILGVTAQTLRNWDKEGKLKPSYVKSNGYRYYSEDSILSYTQERKIKNKYTKRINNLKEAHIDYVITSLIHQRPKIICIEDLDVKGMKESEEYEDVAKGIQQNPFRKFLKALEDRCNNYGIKIIKVDRYYASSKTCNKCNYKKKDLKLSDRIFICPKCGLKINRDYNAAINIKKYVLEHMDID